jgi:HAD superfamily hydrolase (TIGR01484 family)
MYKILLLDVDGTLVKSDPRALPSHRVTDAVKAAQKQAHVALVTGRPKSFADNLIDVLGLKGPSVFNGGAEIIDVNSGGQFHRQSLSVTTLQELVKISAPFNYALHLESDHRGAAITKPEQVTQEAAKLVIEGAAPADAIRLVEELMAVKGASAQITTSWAKGDVVDIDITHEHANKRYGAGRLIRLLGCTKNEVMAIGDSHNDMPLLETAGFKVAMGNAPEEVQALADYIAPSLDDDGVATAIEKHML